jgi:hypothetical protein
VQPILDPVLGIVVAKMIGIKYSDKSVPLQIKNVYKFNNNQCVKLNGMDLGKRLFVYKIRINGEDSTGTPLDDFQIYFANERGGICSESLLVSLPNSESQSESESESEYEYESESAEEEEDNDSRCENECSDEDTESNDEDIGGGDEDGVDVDEDLVIEPEVTLKFEDDKIVNDDGNDSDTENNEF